MVRTMMSFEADLFPRIMMNSPVIWLSSTLDAHRRHHRGISAAVSGGVVIDAMFPLPIRSRGTDVHDPASIFHNMLGSQNRDRTYHGPDEHAPTLLAYNHKNTCGLSLPSTLTIFIMQNNHIFYVRLIETLICSAAGSSKRHKIFAPRRRLRM